jgi:hypothetical protein
MSTYKAFQLHGHVWIPVNPLAPDHIYIDELEGFFHRMQISMDASVAKDVPKTGPTLDSHLDAAADPPWLTVDKMWAGQFKARAETTTETLMYERLLRSHYASRYSSNSLQGRTQYGKR